MRPLAQLLILALVLPIALHAQQAAPELSISVNGGRTANVYPGWPLIVHVTIMNSLRLPTNGNAAPLVIAPTGVPWTSAIQITALSSSGQSFQWPLELVGAAADASLSLQATSYVRLTFQMAPADVSAIPPGTYQLTALLQVSNSSGWNGVVQSKAATIQVGPEPTLTPALQSRKSLLISEYDMNANDLDGALTTVQQLLQAQPNNSSASSAAANLLELQGQPVLAFFQASNAIDSYYQANPSLYDPPSNLLGMYQRLFDAMVASGSISATTTSAGAVDVPFSPTPQTVTLTATVLSAGGPVNGGTVTFKLSGVGNAVTSTPVAQGNVSAVFSIPAGTQAGIYPINATYNGIVTFSGSSDFTKTLTITKVTPAITWNNPPAVIAGTALGPTQLNATASVPGAFVYSPPAGTVLLANPAQILNVAFTPADSVDYNSANASVLINVTPLLGDVNGDGVVNCADLAIVKASFGKKTGQTGFDPRADVNHDGVVNIIDLSTVARQLPAGTKCP